MAALGLPYYSRAFSSCGEQGLLSRCGARLLCSGFSCCRARLQGAQASGAVVHAWA